MYDTSKVLAGIVIFLLLISSPVLYNAATGQAAYVPELNLGTDSTHCVESAGFMRANHMNMLDDWRIEVVRGSSRIYKAADGKTYEKSLTNTCIGCHSKQTEFCQKCHDYAGVETPTCWNCHHKSLDLNVLANRQSEE